MAVATITVRVDHENNAETFWDAFRAAMPAVSDSDPEVYALCRQLEKDGEVELPPDASTVQRFSNFVMGLPWVRRRS